MSSIVTDILRSTAGVLWNKVRDKTAEKLRGGDVTNARIGEIVVRELDDIKKKLDGLSRKDLLSSCTLVQEGINMLYLSLSKLNLEQKALADETVDDRAKTSRMTTGAQSEILNEVMDLSCVVDKLKVNADKECEKAKKRFEQARLKANDAFSNEALSVKDRIFAVELRIVSEILECLDSPDIAIKNCLSFLRMLHNLPAIKDIFNVYINGGVRSLTGKTERAENVKSVMLINCVLFQYVLKFSSKNSALQCWPTIDLPDRSFYPISQWMEISTRKSMGVELDQHPGRVVLDEGIIPDAIDAGAVNIRREVIVKASRNSVKVISSTGESKTVELPDPKEFDNVTQHRVEAFAVDKNDKVYVLRGLKTQTNFRKAESCALSILDQNYNVIHTCLLDFLKIAEKRSKMAINKNNDIIISQADDPYVYICDDVGQLKHKFDTMNSEGRPILCISGKNEILISRHCTEEVQIYTEEGNLKSTIKLPEAYGVLSVAFHHVMCKIIVLTRDYKHFLVHHLCLYSESGELESTALFRAEEFGWHPAVTSHPSGPVAVLTNKSITFI